MIHKKKHLLIVAVLACLALVLLTVGCSLRGAGETGVPRSSRMEVDLSMSSAPALNEMAELTCTLLSPEDTPGVTATVELPEAFELVAGGLVWKGDIAINSPVQFRATIKSIKTGDWVIEAKALYFPYEGACYGDVDYLYISVSEDAATASKVPPQLPDVPYPMERVDPSEIPDFGTSLASPEVEPPKVPPPESASSGAPDGGKVLPGSPGALKVTGKFLCYISEDDLPAPGQKRSDEMVAMVWGGVYIYDGNDEFLGSGTTDSEGEFEIYVENPGPDVGFYVKIKPHTTACHVTKANWPWYSDYWAQTPTFYPSFEATSYDIEEWVIPDIWQYKGAWRIYETIANDHYDRGAWDFLKYEGPGWTAPEITVRFPAGETCYNTGSHVIEIELEDYTKALDVVQHEYGHAVMHAVYNYYWPPGNCPSPHYIREESGLGCAWREGWANFFPLAVQSYERWDDAVFEWGTGDQQPLETPTWDTSGWDDGDEVEGRVAGALWDIYDVPADYWDQLSGGFDDIWDTFTDGPHDTFHELWDDFKGSLEGEDLFDGWGSLYQSTIEYGCDICECSGYEELVLGDANENGTVNMSDVTKIERIILELDSPTVGADVNKDRTINMADVTRIYYIILGLWPPDPCPPE